MKEHLRYIRNPKKYPEQTTGSHFNLPNHSIKDFQTKIIFKMPGPPIKDCRKRIEKEEYFIDQLKTRKPAGLNDRTARHKSRN
jgi:hypothetical protein